MYTNISESNRNRVKLAKKKSNRNRVCMIKHNTSVCEREICKAYKKIKINQNFQIIQNILVRRKCAFNVEGDISGFLLEGPNLRRLHSRNFKSVLKILNGDLLLGSFNYLSISTSIHVFLVSLSSISLDLVLSTLNIHFNRRWIQSRI